jgi:hypothetical protein
VAILDKGKLVECNKVTEITQTDTQLRMSFARSLTEVELEVVRGVVGVVEVTIGEDNTYTLRLDLESKNRKQDEVVTDIVKGLVVTGAVPRSISSGVALESRFIEVTQQKS